MKIATYKLINLLNHNMIYFDESFHIHADRRYLHLAGFNKFLKKYNIEQTETVHVQYLFFVTDNKSIKKVFKSLFNSYKDANSIYALVNGICNNMFLQPHINEHIDSILNLIDKRRIYNVMTYITNLSILHLPKTKQYQSYILYIIVNRLFDFIRPNHYNILIYHIQSMRNSVIIFSILKLFKDKKHFKYLNTSSIDILNTLIDDIMIDIDILPEDRLRLYNILQPVLRNNYDKLCARLTIEAML